MNNKAFEEALQQTGATKCEFGPDEDECETCGKPNLQLYYIRTCYEVDEGEYCCAECIKKLPAIWEEMAEGYARLAETIEEISHD